MQLNNALPIADDELRTLIVNNPSCINSRSLTSSKEAQKTILSIMILTMNRKNELLRTIQSCTECVLPELVEFVIVDNASQDGTKEAIERVFQENLFEYHYYYLSENVGSAAGRNEGYKNAKGRYVYFIEDDAYIDGPKQNFFTKMINFLDENEDVFCVTTSIFDTALNCNRSIIASKNRYINKYDKALMFHGGSFMVDRQRGFDREELFLGHQMRGMPELYPSLKSYFSDRFIVEMKDLNVIHDPVESTRYYSKISIIRHYVHATHVKLIFYPLVSYPLVYLMFYLRILKHLGYKAVIEAGRQLSLVKKYNQKETVSFTKFLKLVREFGFRSTF